jgi:hypothetical protein
VVENLREEHAKSISLNNRISSLCVCVCVRARARLVQRFDIICVLLPINAASNFKFEF